MSKILIIYGSTGGNTEIVAEAVRDILKENGLEASSMRVETTDIADLTKHDCYILAASTYGHGILQDHFIAFAEQLKETPLSGKKFAIIGLGDSKYDAEYNVESAPILENIVRTQGGELLLHALRINKSPIPKLKTDVTEWALTLARILKQQT